MNIDYEIKNITAANNGLYAKRNYNKWSNILNIQPIVWAVFPTIKNKVCNYCLMEKELVRCSQCKGFYYCSYDCQKNDWPIHKLQCPVYKRMLNKKLSTQKQITPLFAINLRLWFRLESQQSIKTQFQKMANLSNYQYPQNLQYFQSISVALMDNLQLQKTQTNLSKLIWQLNILWTNIFTIQDFTMKYDQLAIGLYYPANYLNHGCQPNCSQVFDGRYLNIICNQDIKAQTELTISYVNVLEDYETRQCYLKKSYLFCCFCQTCQVEKMMGGLTNYLLCPLCHAGQLLKQKVNQDFKQQITQKCKNYRCSIKQCNFVTSIQKLQELKQNIKNLWVSIQKQKQYKKCKKCFFQLKKILHFKHPSFAKCIQKVYQTAIDAYLISQNADQKSKLLESAYILMNQNVNQLQTWYRRQDDLYIFYSKYAQLGKISYNLNKKIKALQNTEKALNIVKKLTLRNKHPEIKELQQRAKQLKIESSFAKASTFSK